MPIFEYKCNDCGQVCEFLEKNSKPQKHQCTKCGSSNLQKKLSGFAVGPGKSGDNTCNACLNGPCQAECEGLC